MVLEELQDKLIAVLGLGVNNSFLTAYLSKHGCGNITVRDKNDSVKEEFAKNFPDIEIEAIQWEIRPDILADLSRFDIVFRSPSIPVLSPELRETQDSVTVTSQTKLFFDLCPARIIGVTGSKGKGTTCTLINRILSQNYTEGTVYLAGNIGVDPFQFLESLTSKDIVVLELSSFQLQDLHKSPAISVLLRITQDHLDHHGSVEEYRKAKLNLISHQTPQDSAIICVEQPEAEAYMQETQAAVLTYTRHDPQESGGWSEGDTVHIRIPGKEEETIDVSNRLIPGDHNLENIIPACLVGKLLGVSTEAIRQAVVTCKGLPHRLFNMGEFEGVQFVDDSIATTPESCLVAMQAFEGRRIHLIAGGRDKGQDYQSLVTEIGQRCASVSLLPGEATGYLKDLLTQQLGERIKLIVPQTDPYFPEILNALRGLFQPGDVVLLSPAAASDAPYFNYKKRSEVFTEAVRSVFGINADKS